MELIGMLDSPYVRRVAICLKLLRLDFVHRSISVFSGFDDFQRINPVVKAPTLVLDDARVLMDSTLILDYARAASTHTGLPRAATLDEHVTQLQLTGLALAAAEKTVQIVYEKNLRPLEKVHQPWIDRVSGQLVAAYSQLETRLPATPVSEAGVTIAVTWQFTQMMLPDLLAIGDFPRLRAFSDDASTLPEFISTPAR